MSAKPAPHLAVVANAHVADIESGEIAPQCPSCEALAVQLRGAETEVRAWRARYANLEGEKDAEARADKAWPTVVRLFGYWQRKCGYPGAKFTPKRFRLAQPLLKKFGLEACIRAIDGAAYDPYVTKQRNGKPKLHSGFDLIFRDAEKLENFRDKVPDGWRPPVGLESVRQDEPARESRWKRPCATRLE
jgi:hypothetical protein